MGGQKIGKVGGNPSSSFFSTRGLKEK